MDVTKQFHKRFGTLPFGKGHICCIQIQLKINEMKIDVEGIENVLVIIVLKKKKIINSQDIFHSFLLGNWLN